MLETVYVFFMEYRILPEYFQTFCQNRFCFFVKVESVQKTESILTKVWKYSGSIMYSIKSSLFPINFCQCLCMLSFILECQFMISVEISNDWFHCTVGTCLLL